MPNPYVEVDCLGEKRTTQVPFCVEDLLTQIVWLVDGANCLGSQETGRSYSSAMFLFFLSCLVQGFNLLERP